MTEDDVRLMKLPLDVKYQSLKDRVPGNAASLARRAAKFLTLSSEFKPQTVAPHNKPLSKEPRYPAWQKSVLFNGTYYPFIRSGSMSADWYRWNNGGKNERG